MSVKGTIMIVVAGAMLLIAKDACQSGGGGGPDTFNSDVATAVPLIGAAQDVYSRAIDGAASAYGEGVQGSLAQQACAAAPDLCR
jgi:hypothetical protein